MDETAANDQPSPPDVWDTDEQAPPRKGEPGEVFLTLGPETRAALAEMGRVNEQCNAGLWDAYAGEHIAVANGQLLGHNRDLIKLREQVARDHPEVSVYRLVVLYIPPDFTC